MSEVYLYLLDYKLWGHGIPKLSCMGKNLQINDCCITFTFYSIDPYNHYHLFWISYFLYLNQKNTYLGHTECTFRVSLMQVVLCYTTVLLQMGNWSWTLSSDLTKIFLWPDCKCFCFINSFLSKLCTLNEHCTRTSTWLLNFVYKNCIK